MTQPATRAAAPTLPQFATPDELAAALKVPVKTLAAWRTRRTGPTFYRVGTHVRYPVDQLDNWFATLADEANTWRAS